ncbi:MAG: hypothetical protein WD801_13285 [Gemmatimonadaceae bacterium]
MSLGAALPNQARLVLVRHALEHYVLIRKNPFGGNTMRLISPAVLATAAVLFAAPLQAQMSFGASLGAAVPVGSSAEGLDIGYNVTAHLGIKPPIAPLGLRIDGMFNSFGFDPDGTLSVIAGTVNATLSGVGMPIPMGYLIGGLGLYRSKASVPGFSAEPNSDLGFNIGAGLNFPLTGFSTFLEARFHYVTGEVESFKFIPITFGMRF